MHSRDTADYSHVAILPLVVILAAGEGSRLSCQADGTPKPVRSLLGMSLAERVLTSCIDAGIKRLLVVLGHMADQLTLFDLIALREVKVGNGRAIHRALFRNRSGGTEDTLKIGYLGVHFHDTCSCRAYA